MKRSLLIVAVVLASGSCYGQVEGVEAGSAEAMQRIAEHQQMVDAGRPSTGELSVNGLRVGAAGQSTFIDAKVMQVIDDNHMLVGIEDSRTGDNRYRTWIMLQCPTAGIVDGKFWRGGEWRQVTASAVLKVTGTTTYATALGSTKTVFVVEPVAEVKPTAEELQALRAAAEAYQKAAEAAWKEMEAARWRMWTTADGKYQTEAKFAGVVNKAVVLLKRDESRVNVPMEKLSKQDQEYVRGQSSQTAAKNRFVGRWHVLTEGGQIAAYFTLTSSCEATKDHAPGVLGKWEIVGNEARITWADGWRDVFRPQGDAVLIVSFRPGTSWDDTPDQTLRAEKEIQKPRSRRK